MNEMELATDYISMLRSAMCRPAVRTFVLSRLEISLESIGIDPLCRTEILQVLMTLVSDATVSKHNLANAMTNFQNRWRTHLDRAYLQGYESTRWDFARKFVFNNLSSPLGRCLDVGCGRGCVTTSIVEHGIATEAVGIDAADFTNEWRERFASGRRNVSFHRVAVEDIARWALANGKFDTILLFYVLHHSNDYWVAKTLDGISSALKNKGLIIIVEDSFVEDAAPNEDKSQLYQQWAGWTNGTRSYLLSVGYDVQVVLDFVAVQLLARFSDVRMPSNYKTAKEWTSLLNS